MKNFKLHAIVLGLIVIAEMIGVHSFKVGVGTIVLLPMLFALLLGVLTTPKFLKISGKARVLPVWRDLDGFDGSLWHSCWSYFAENYCSFPCTYPPRIW